jgi:hypothetical protein
MVDVFYDFNGQPAYSRQVKPSLLVQQIQELAQDLGNITHRGGCHLYADSALNLTASFLGRVDYHVRLIFCSTYGFIRNLFNKEEVRRIKQELKRTDLTDVYIEPDGFGLKPVHLTSRNLEGQYLKSVMDLLLDADLRTFQNAEQCEAYLDALQLLMNDLQSATRKNTSAYQRVQHKYDAAVQACLAPSGYERFYLESDIGPVQQAAKARRQSLTREARKRMRQSSRLVPSGTGRNKRQKRSQ